MSEISLTLRLLTVSTILLKKTTIHTINSNRNTINTEYDFVVVGAGTAGGVVANRLAENPNVMVLLLEAGVANSVHSDIPGLQSSLYSSEYVWNYTQVQQFVGRAFAGGRIPDHKGRVLGGTSSINGMVYNRGNRRTFDEWAHVYGADGWTHDEVLPYFKKFENNTDAAIVANGYHGAGGPVQITSWPSAMRPSMSLILLKAMEEMAGKNPDINGPQQSGASIAQSFISEEGVRQSTANSYLDPNPYPMNLHIMTRAMVTKVLIDDRGQASGVEYVRYGKRFTVGARMEVIVSAGSVNSPQVLMLSGIGPREQLTTLGIPVLSELPVGEHYQHHPAVTLQIFINQTYNDLVVDDIPALTIDTLYEYYVQHTGALRGGYNPLIYFSTDFNVDKGFPNGVHSFGIGSPVDDSRYEDREAWRQYYAAYNSTYTFYDSNLLERIRSYGYVRLQSRDPFVQPLINANFLTDSQDFEDMKQIVEFMFEFFEHSSIAAYVLPHRRPIPGCSFCPNQTHVYECASYIRCVIRQITTSTGHTVGSCRMGAANRSDTVVDPRLRVKGVKRLRVCDASVMPTITNGNTNAPTLMIGEKCADLVKEDNHLMGMSLKMKRL